jgi:hypothetical protein
VCPEVAQQDAVTGTERGPAAQHEPEGVVVVVVEPVLAAALAERAHVHREVFGSRQHLRSAGRDVSGMDDVAACDLHRAFIIDALLP